MPTLKEGHWVKFATKLEVWLHDRKCVVDAGYYARVEKLHNDGRVTVQNSGNYLTVNTSMLERITTTEN